MIIKTIVIDRIQGVQFTIPGDLTAAQISAAYGTQKPHLVSAASAEEISTTPEGDVRTVTYTQRTGNKGNTL